MSKIKIHHSSTFRRGARNIAQLNLEINSLKREMKKIERLKKEIERKKND